MNCSLKSGIAVKADKNEPPLPKHHTSESDHSPMPATSHLHLAVALDGAGWHPAAWREEDARPTELLTPRYWTELITEAELGLVDFVTIEDSLSLQSSRYDGPDERTDQVRGRVDAALIAARVAPLTSHIGLIPTVTVTHTEPFHVSKAIATLDYVSNGRAGWRAQLSRPSEGSHFGRRHTPNFRLEEFNKAQLDAAVAEWFDEAADFVEVVRRLWDSWEDDAEIRDLASGRFIDREKLHYIDFEGKWFSVRGPSIVPRPPQGQPLVAALAHASVVYRFAARSADIIFVTPRDESDALAITGEIETEQGAAGRDQETLHVFGDLVVFLDQTPSAAQDRRTRLDELAGEEYTSDAPIFVGTPTQLADLLQTWQRAGLSGFRLRPGTIPHDLEAITRGLVPELQRRGVFRSAYEADSLRALLGLPRPENRYAAV
jgi:alkanesulfonate monooxygenase SsuD/methylene tetrahydromethanopterin reductase-like flavin-dependent oxidoreductase (luciferase family)